MPSFLTNANASSQTPQPIGADALNPTTDIAQLGKRRRKTFIAIVSGICSMIFFVCSQSAIYAAESTSDGQENLKNTLYIEFVYQSTGKTVNVNGVNIQTSKLSGFVLKDAATNEEITYKKLVVGGNTVIGSRVYSEPGINGLNTVEFSFEGGKYTSFGAALKNTISKKYKLENGTLTLLD
ncbi:MAG: hypothetical protein LBE89_00010 [Helicobacteraceae bacterium]|jgi:hypothetical protein|nr:hypothetical protein [Helicobacteraceae bacterium]